MLLRDGMGGYGHPCGRKGTSCPGGWAGSSGCLAQLIVGGAEGEVLSAETRWEFPLHLQQISILTPDILSLEKQRFSNTGVHKNPLGHLPKRPVSN